MSPSAHMRGGFTLLETLAVVVITGFLVASLATMYVAMMNNTERATQGAREIRVATAVLDRVARDLEGAFVLVRDAEEDPLSHPWLFKAESHTGQLAADRVMFTTLSHSSPQYSPDRPSTSGLATYAYWLEGDELTGYDLLRWVNPQLAEDHGFPLADNEDAVVVAENLAAFSLRFLDDVGGWSEEWDSTALVDSSELPIAVEIRLALPPQLDPEELALREEFGDTIEPREYRKRVVLYQRALTPEVALGLGGGNGGGGEEEESGAFMHPPPCPVSKTFGECREAMGDAAFTALKETEQAHFVKYADMCFTEISLDMYPACRR
ncbi:MAG: type II secretion system protein GspJ [Myxococcota bacterium]|nr:type II secretion system protein GspJ [Myxococcota bacterium]